MTNTNIRVTTKILRSTGGFLKIHQLDSGKSLPVMSSAQAAPSNRTSPPMWDLHRFL